MALLLKAWSHKTPYKTSPQRQAQIIVKRPLTRKLRASVIFCALSFLCLWGDSPPGARNLRVQQADNVTSYNQINIMETAKHLPMFTPRLLVFDGQKFEAFGLAHKDTFYFDAMKYNFRYSNTIPLLVRALKELWPERFEPGQPVFELLLSDADSSNSPCVNNKDCPVDRFSPILMFGTIPKDESVFPTMKSFPHTLFLECLYEYKVDGRQECIWPQEVNPDILWDDLIDTLIWRGSDYSFLNYHDEFRYEGPNKIKHLFDPLWKNSTKDEILYELTSTLYWQFNPRWRAVFQSVKAETQPGSTPWIDVRFVGGMNTDVHEKLDERGIRVTGEKINAFNMSKYKYQIDLGGGGGTTWEGTVSKLRMPGVLFHHETPNKDWFYDLMVPWKHYVPVKCGLNDLRSKWIFAKNSPEQMKQISKDASKLADYLLSKEYMDKVYQELFVDYLGKLVHSYRPSGSWENAKYKYKEHGYELFSIGVCDNDFACTMHCRKNRNHNIPMVNLKKVPTDKGIFDVKHAVAVPAAPNATGVIDSQTAVA